MKHRFRWVAAIVAAVVLAAGGFYRWPLASARVAGEAGARDWPGGIFMRGPGRASLSLLPFPALHLVDAEWDGRTGAPVMTSPRTDFRLALLPLLSGRLEFTGATLRQPTAFIDLDAEPADLAASYEAGAGSHWPPELTISQGLIHLVSAARQIDALIEDVDGSLNFSGPASPLSANFHATWRDEPVSIGLSLDQLAPKADGLGSAASASLEIGKASLKFNGRLIDNATLEGSLGASVPASTPLKRLFGLPDDAFVPLQDISLESSIRADRKSVDFTPAHLSIGGQKIEGALNVAAKEGQVALSGTLAGDAINLDKLFAAAPNLFDASAGWSAARLNLPTFSELALDLRLSAARVDWRGHGVDNAAVAVIGRDGQWSLTLLEATAYKGILKGELSAHRKGAGLALRARANLAGADVGALLGEFGVKALSGQGIGEFALDAEGESPRDFVRGLSGDAAFQISNGAVEGMSFEEALRRSARRSIDPASDMRMGRTIFSEANARFKIAQGHAHIVDASLIGPGVNVKVDGDLDLVGRQIAARASAAQTDSASASAPDGLRLIFDLSGPWMAPSVTPGSGG